MNHKVSPFNHLVAHKTIVIDSQAAGADLAEVKETAARVTNARAEDAFPNKQERGT